MQGRLDQHETSFPDSAAAAVEWLVVDHARRHRVAPSLARKALAQRDLALVREELARVYQAQPSLPTGAAASGDSP